MIEGLAPRQVVGVAIGRARQRGAHGQRRQLVLGAQRIEVERAGRLMSRPPAMPAMAMVRNARVSMAAEIASQPAAGSVGKPVTPPGNMLKHRRADERVAGCR